MEQRLKVTRELIEDEFSNDQLFIANTILSKDELFPSFLESLYVDEQYSTKRAAELIGNLLEKGTENHLRYYMRSTNLEAYIQPLQLGRQFRLLYKSIYRLYLISLYLTADEKRNLIDIKNILPEYSVQPIAKGRNGSANGTDVEERPNNAVYQAALGALLQAKESKEALSNVGEFVSDFWNDFITNTQVLYDINTNLGKLLPLKTRLAQEEGELKDLQIQLANKKNELRDIAQFENMERMFNKFKNDNKSNKSSKDESASFWNFFKRKKEESKDNVGDDTFEFSRVTGDEDELKVIEKQIEGKNAEIQVTKAEIKVLEDARIKLLAKQTLPDQARINKMLELVDSLSEKATSNNLTENETAQTIHLETKVDGETLVEVETPKNGAGNVVEGEMPQNVTDDVIDAVGVKK